ncbi:hypothetical protein F5Y12DRAFT_65380 [Xylaria sp. FL1777]|nr:hypothetical protein F5Y12DRAFT_65380 [Xylaria sp. FL1777]
MDIPEGQDATPSTPSIYYDAQMPAGIATNRRGLGNSVGVIPMSPIAEIKRNAICSNRIMSTSRPPAGAVATFNVSGEPDAIRGVIKALYHDLKDGNKDANIEFEETTGYIRIEAPTEEDALALIRTCQRLTATHLSGHSNSTKIFFVEPPTTCKTSHFQISVNIIDATKRARGVVQSLSDTQGSALELASNRYRQKFSKDLCEAFEMAASLHSSLILKIYLGYYLLETYRTGSLTLEQFESMVKHPRATGQLDTRLGRVPEDWWIEATMRQIQASNSPCVPIDNQTPTSAHVTPTYVLESWHDDDRYETELETIKTKQRGINEPLRFTLARTKMIPQSAQVPRFEAISLSIDSKLDWKIIAMPGDDKKKASPAVKQYLKKGTAELQGSCDNFRSYPAIRLPGSPLATKLKSATIKSIYWFSWKGSGYVVQFTINRRWQSIHEMNIKAPADLDFDVTIYGDNWEQDSRVQSGETVGKIWGNELQGLLRDEAGDATGCAVSRVQGLIQTVLDIRDFFDGISRV